jgi:hypothetical protein
MAGAGAEPPGAPTGGSCQAILRWSLDTDGSLLGRGRAWRIAPLVSHDTQAIGWQ